METPQRKLRGFSLFKMLCDYSGRFAVVSSSLWLWLWHD